MKRKRGRPPMPKAMRKRNHVWFRARDTIMTQLRAAAKESGRSVSEEIEWRLEQLFAGLPKLLTESELIARYPDIGLTPRTLRNERKARRLAFIQIGRRICFSETAIANWLNGSRPHDAP